MMADGSPDDNCIFVADRDNQISSSIMAIPYVNNVKLIHSLHNDVLLINTKHCRMVTFVMSPRI